MKPIHERIIAINAEQSALYVADEAPRLRYWAKHPTFFGCIKCMDGRVLFHSMTNTPIGIVKPFRAIGGKFHVWWPSFLGRVRHWVDKAVSIGSRNFLFVTYHYSAGDAHLGCAGWTYDTSAARAHAERLCADLGSVFSEQLTAVVAGVETDQDNLILHGPNGDVSGASLIGASPEDVAAAIRRAFPRMDPLTITDLVPFMLGNAERVKELKASPRGRRELGHNERIIAIGQGFDWLAEANLALIINDADPNLAESIRVAASLIEKNIVSAPPGDDAAIFTCIPYRDPGVDERQAAARARGLKAFTESVVCTSCPGLFESGRLHSMAAVMWEPNKKIDVIDAT
ncbi:hypothetical protein HY479_03240 [Candidatus Uhrbacteria bacterium]|nr:hypothetical protein [Candidatus Uhrbacteria bacterium]